MPGRIDYHDDPSAPPANSIVPSVNVVVENHTGQILKIRRARQVAGHPTPSNESKKVHWIEPAQLANLSMSRRIAHYLERPLDAVFD